MTIQDYDTKVPAHVKAENNEKMAGYDSELVETIKQQDQMKQFL